jgi:hypothetical protein
MEIQKSKREDLPAMLEIYAQARSFMAQNGNPTQWAGGYPAPELLEEDIARGNSYVCLEKGKIVGTFAWIIGSEPTYQIIEAGTWRQDTPYGTIHRLASDGKTHGVAAACFAFCRQQIPHLRIDTHGDNLPMQGAIEKFGFCKRGIIYVADGSPRIAYDYCGEA